MRFSKQEDKTRGEEKMDKAQGKVMVIYIYSVQLANRTFRWLLDFVMKRLSPSTY
jgi:hypothetical protein